MVTKTKAAPAETMAADELRQLNVALRALAQASRLRILSLLSAGGSMTVMEITDELDNLSQPTVSHHLHILREAGLVEEDQRGVFHYYQLVPAAMNEVADKLKANYKPRR